MKTFVLLFALLLLVTPALAWGLDAKRGSGDTPEPNFSGSQKCYTVPYANSKPLDFDNLASMSVRVSLNGGPAMRLQIDTGSTGVVVGAADVPNIDPNAPAGSITYSSSGVELNGVWTTATITFPDAKDGHGNVATAVVPVLAVTERKVHAGAVNSSKFQPSKNPRPYMLGIGFGRGKEPKQERNPWVCLKEMQSGEMRRGYMLARDKITLGLTADAVGKGFVFEKLEQRFPAKGGKDLQTNAPKDWESSKGWVTVDGDRKPVASMLLDTGLSNMMIGLPEVTAISDLAERTPVEVSLLSGKLSYRFDVGDAKNPSTPSRVSFTPRTAGASVNTGRRALANFDYLYDGDGGYLALRSTRKLP